MNFSTNSTMYTYERDSVTARFCAHLQAAGENATTGLFCVISERALPAEAKAALENSAESLGYGRTGCFYITLAARNNGEVEGAGAGACEGNSQGEGEGTRTCACDGNSQGEGEGEGTRAREGNSQGEGERASACAGASNSQDEGASNADVYTLTSIAAREAASGEAASAIPGATLSAQELFALVEGLDPLAVVAADAAAAQALVQAYQIDPPLPLDTFTRVLGRNTVTFRSFARMLGTPQDKQHAWALLKKLQMKK